MARKPSCCLPAQDARFALAYATKPTEQDVTALKDEGGGARSSGQHGWAAPALAACALALEALGEPAQAALHIQQAVEARGAETRDGGEQRQPAEAGSCALEAWYRGHLVRMLAQLPDHHRGVLCGKGAAGAQSLHLCCCNDSNLAFTGL